MTNPFEDPVDRRLFDIGALWADAHYNPTTRLQGNSVRGGAAYALFLVAAGDADGIQTAEDIVDAVIAEQVVDPAHPQFGLYKTSPEAETCTDANWAAFCGSYLMHIPRVFGERVSDRTSAAIEASVQRACAFITARDVTPRYTNIALLSASVLTVAGEMYGWKPVLEEGRRKVLEFRDTLNLTGGFCEYTSPTYYGTNCSALSWMTNFVADEEIRTVAQAVEARLWQSVAAHYHAPTLQVAGPYSRAYGNILQRYAAGFKYYLYKVLREAFDPGDSVAHGHDTSYAALAALQTPCCPDDARDAMLEGELPRTVIETVSAEGDVGSSYSGPYVQLTTRLTRFFALGSVNTGEAWSQRRNIMLHWRPSEDHLAALWPEFREDDETVRGRDIRFWAAQKGRRLLALYDLGGLAEKTLSSLTMALCAEVDTLPEAWIGEREVEALPATFGGHQTVTLRFGDLAVGLKFRVASLDGERGTGHLRASREGFEVALDLHRGDPTLFSGQALAQLPCVFSLKVQHVSSAREFETFRTSVLESEIRAESAEGGVDAHWRTETTVLAIRPRKGAERDWGYRTTIDGQPVVPQRLFEERL